MWMTYSFLARCAATTLLVAMLTSLTASNAASAQDRGRLGVEIKDLTKEEAEKLGLEQGHGVRVVRSV
jgi:S1-C subfamily serine protease